jgi:hypothetical protein
MTPPDVRSLLWLQTQLELDGHLYPGSDALRRAVDELVKRMPNDDACAPLGAFGMRRVFYNGKKLTLVPLIYRLCTPAQPDIPTARMQRLCACASECANPRHWLPLLLFKQRERELQRNQYGNTRLTEAILAAHHPTAPRRRAGGAPKRLIYKRLHVYVRMDARSYAHIAPVKANSKLVGVFTLPPTPTRNDVSVRGPTDNNCDQGAQEAPAERAGSMASAAGALDDAACRSPSRGGGVDVLLSSRCNSGSLDDDDSGTDRCDTPALHRDAAADETYLPACAQACLRAANVATRDDIRLVPAR